MSYVGGRRKPRAQGGLRGTGQRGKNRPEGAQRQPRDFTHAMARGEIVKTGPGSEMQEKGIQRLVAI